MNASVRTIINAFAMKHDRFKAKLDALDALGAESDPKVVGVALRKALLDRSNYIIAKAATIIGRRLRADLIPDVRVVFDRLIDDTEADPGCRGKDALAKALKDLELYDPAPFLRGLAHHQWEPVWGGKTDVAGTLRATCAQALVACDIDPTVLLELLTDRFADADKAVRIEVALAIAQVGRPESALLLRLKALCGDPEAEVVGQCLTSLLDLAPAGAVEFVARFLLGSNEQLRFEAVSALAQARSADAITHIMRFWGGVLSFELRRATVAALAGSPLTQGADFLVELITHQKDDIGVAALTALAASRFRADVRERAAAEVRRSGSTTLQRAFEIHFAQR